MDKKINYKYLNFLLILCIIYVVYLMNGIWVTGLKKVFSILFPFFISFVIAYCLYPILKFLVNKKIPKTIGVFIIVISILLIFGLTFYFALPIFFNQLGNLLSSLSKVLADLAVKYSIDTTFANNFINNYSIKIFKIIGDFISNGSFINVISVSINYITKFIIVFIVTIYFLFDMDKIKLKIKEYLIKKNKKKYYIVSTLNNEVHSYLKGLSIFMLIQFFEYTFLFFIIGHPNFLLIGLLASITTIIPYFGGLFTNIMALIIASVVSPKVFILSLIVTIVFPNIDGYIISPKIYGKTNQLPTILSIFAVFAGGALFGFIGIVIAVPLTIIIMSLYKTYKIDINRKILNIKGKYNN